MTIMEQQRQHHSNPAAAASAAGSTTICATCGHSGCDVRIKSCPNGCAYHARCLDIMAITRRPPPATSANSAVASSSEHDQLVTCPCCSSPASGLEMIPLSFTEIDSAQRLSGYNKSKARTDSLSAPPGKRMHIELMNSSSDPSQSHASSSFYDPSSPRTGKWSDEEIAFRDSLVPHFVDGSLPLPSGLKLIDFLASILKSKPSRLTKKMKHAKLSTRHFHLDAGCIRSQERAAEVSMLERAFVDCISDPVERSEIKFHMQREWRDHLAERLTYLRVSFDAEEWLKSVDVMDRRITLSKSRNRMVKRRFMMGKAMEEDTSIPTPGIFIDASGIDHGATQDDVDFELLASALETNDAEDADLRDLYSGISSGDHHHQAGAAGANGRQGAGAGGGGDTHEVSLDGSARTRHSISSIATSSRPPSACDHTSSLAPFRSALLPSLGSAEGPNFRFAAPFLAKITSYIEHNRVPFEHVDIWVPSASDGFPSKELDPTGATAPEPTVLGSGSGAGGVAGAGAAGSPARGGGPAAAANNATMGRLCFAGSASMGVQILSDDDCAGMASPGNPQASSPVPGHFDHRAKPGLKVVPLSSDEIYHLNLFGSYSEKFSFTSGCGLPGRVFESAVPAWEQFIANAPSHLFERRGGAMQFGIKTALGLPIRSPNVGRIVVVLYSKHNREKNDELVAQMVRDFQTLNPCPRWKLMVDMGPNNTTSRPQAQGRMPPLVEQPMPQQQQASLGLSQKNVQISDLISLLGENMPSDPTSQLGQQLHNIMSLRLVLLRKDRNAEDEQLVDSILTLFDSYVKAGRSRPDITLMLARDFAFHLIQHQQQQQYQHPQQPVGMGQQPMFQRQASFPAMQHLSIGASALQQLQPQQQHHAQQQDISCQLDHLHHGEPQQQQQGSSSFSTTPDFQIGGVSPKLPSPSSGTNLQRSHSTMSMNGSHSITSMNRGPSASSLAERNYSNSNLQVSPRSSASLSRMESKNHGAAAAPVGLPLNEPPSSLHS